jgi:F0F1-type ATP synthase membrane subunit b/b'
VKLINNTNKKQKGAYMNPAFILLVILLAILLWFLLAFAYKPFGRLIHRIGKDAMDEINDKEEKDEKETK